MYLLIVSCLTLTVQQTLLIPVLVTGIQSSRVCAAEELFSSQGFGMGLDPCDEHRGEGGWSAHWDTTSTLLMKRNGAACALTSTLVGEEEKSWS